jgi:uncharacterized protein (TIGR02466 family)
MEIKATLQWSTPLVEVVNPDHARMKEGLVRCCYEMERQAQTPIESGVAPALKSGLYESRFDLFMRDIPEIRDFRQFCGEALSRTVLRLHADATGSRETPPGLNVDIFESWAHVTHDGGYHESHIHPNCSWCGIYYLEAGDCTFNPPNGVNRFFPTTQIQYVDFGTMACAQVPVSRMPIEGKLILFPSYVAHSATPYRGKRDRIVLSFNARVIVRPPKA